MARATEKELFKELVTQVLNGILDGQQVTECSDNMRVIATERPDVSIPEGFDKLTKMEKALLVYDVWLYAARLDEIGAELRGRIGELDTPDMRDTHQYDPREDWDLMQPVWNPEGPGSMPADCDALPF